MTPEQLQRLHPLYEHLLGLTPDAQKTFVAALRQTDGAIAAQLESLLAVAEQETIPTEKSEPQHGQARAPSHFRPGDLIDKRFRIVRLIGSGGMGEVYAAQDLQLGRVALKTIRADLVSRAGMLESFRLEVQLSRRISHPHVCRIHELFVSERGMGEEPLAFLTMEYIEGESLAERVARGPLPWPEAEAIALQLCDGLQAIHEAGIIHRDFKSRNVMVTSRSGELQAVITDFGLAQESASALAGERAGAGTPEYMAPEQFERKATSPATDIYALGVVLYEMLTALHPFKADSLAGTAVRRARRPTPVFEVQKHVPHRLNGVIECCIRYEAADRYQSAGQVAAALRARPWNRQGWQRELRKALAHPRVAVSLLTLFLILLAAAAWWRDVHKYHPPNAKAQQWFQAGLAAVREGTYIKAANALQEALKSDEHFALAHAWLAETWNELDYYGQAKDEILRASAPDVAQNLPEEQRLYLEAIRATVLHEFQQAVRSYSALLTILPDDARPDAYVDLGRAYEHAGDLKHATEAYRHAAQLAPEGAAAFMRIGVLEARQSHTAGAHAAFDQAERIYKASSNYEGVAEVEYQRGYEASFDLHPAKARQHLERAILMARQLNDLPLQARSLCRLSATEYNDDHDEQGAAYAQQAIDLAESNGMGYWATDGRIRLANSYLYQTGKLELAAKYDEQALGEAQRNQWPLLLANARLTLASLRNEQKRPGEALPLTEAAFTYYESAGYYTESATTLVLAIRANRDLGEFTRARKLCARVPAVERGSGDPSTVSQLEEAVASVDEETGEFPDALTHYSKSKAIAQESRSTFLPYEVRHLASVHWKLGNYDAAEAELTSLEADGKKDKNLAQAIATTACEMNVSRHRLAAIESGSPIDKTSLKEQVCLADARFQSGQYAQGLRMAEDALASAEQRGATSDAARINFLLSKLYLANGSADRSLAAAVQCQPYFVAIGAKETEWQELAIWAAASERLEHTGDAAKYRAAALDILNGLSHNWGTSVYEMYRQRPDVKELMAKLVEPDKKEHSK